MGVNPHLEKAKIRVIIVEFDRFINRIDRLVDAIIAQVDAGALCASALVVDGPKLKRDGAHALWIEPGGIRLRPAEDSEGARVWNKAKGAEADDGEGAPQ